MHPELTGALVEARTTDLRASGRPRSAATRSRPLRQRTGHWLVAVGQRLAAPAPLSR